MILSLLLNPREMFFYLFEFLIQNASRAYDLDILNDFSAYVFLGAVMNFQFNEHREG